MYICLSCLNYTTDCQCQHETKRSKKQIVEIDDDFADLILNLNRVFTALKLDLKTIFCCAGHVVPKITSEFFAYIMFEGDFWQFMNLIRGIDKIQKEPLFKRNPDLDFSASVFNAEKCHYTLSVHLHRYKHTPKNSRLFLKGRDRMIAFLNDKIAKAGMI